MARYFVRLKLRLLANRVRTSSVMGMVGFVLIWVAGVIGGVLGGLAVFGLGRLTEEPGLILMAAYTIVFVGWMVIPASFSALEDTLDARRFELLPLTSRQLITGLLAAGAMTPGGVGTLIGLTIATFSSFPGWRHAPILGVVVLVEWLMCLLVARLITTVLSNLLASRRTREVATLVFGLGIVLVGVVPALLNPPGDEIEVTVTSLEGLGVLVWTPPGALARSVGLFSDGDALAGLGLVVYGGVVTVAIGWAWAAAVRKMLTTAPVSSRQGRRQDSLDRTLALTPGWFRLPSGPVLGTAAKELRYLVRDNRVRSQLLGSVVPVLVVAFLFGRSLAASDYGPFVAAGAAFLLVFAIGTNLFGMDGGSFWGYVVSPASLTDVVKGKDLGWGVIVFPPVVVVAVAMAVWSGVFVYLVAAVLASVALLLIALAIGNVTSIYGAFPIPESNPFGNKGFSGNVFVAVIVSMMASGVLLLPLGGLVVLPVIYLGAVAATIGALLGVGYGLLVYWLLMKLTTRLLVERRQHLLEVMDG